jgi:hypothetical protein
MNQAATLVSPVDFNVTISSPRETKPHIKRKAFKSTVEATSSLFLMQSKELQTINDLVELVSSTPPTPSGMPD